MIDEDLGRSGGGAVRPGFERLLVAICEGRVGIVLSLEASRLARNGRDWHTLLGVLRPGRLPAGGRVRRLRSAPAQRPAAARNEGNALRDGALDAAPARPAERLAVARVAATRSPVRAQLIPQPRVGGLVCPLTQNLSQGANPFRGQFRQGFRDHWIAARQMTDHLIEEFEASSRRLRRNKKGAHLAAFDGFGIGMSSARGGHTGQPTHAMQ